MGCTEPEGVKNPVASPLLSMEQNENAMFGDSSLTHRSSYRTFLFTEKDITVSITLPSQCRLPLAPYAAKGLLTYRNKVGAQ